MTVLVRLAIGDGKQTRAAQPVLHKDAEALGRFPGRYRFFMGEQDWFYSDMIAALDRLEPGSLVAYPGVNHLESFQRSDLILNDLRSFLADER